MMHDFMIHSLSLYECLTLLVVIVIVLVLSPEEILQQLLISRVNVARGLIIEHNTLTHRYFRNILDDTTFSRRNNKQLDLEEICNALDL
jgi:hypothetical protein